MKWRPNIYAVFFVLSAFLLTPSTTYAAWSWSDIWGAATSSPVSFFASAVIGLFGSIFTGIGYVFITFAGALFDGAVAISVTSFGQLFGSSTFESAIYLVWQVFRDIGNIVMIFMFVFIAFMTILDSHEYNIKSHAAKIIIVALFINFSLFFTKAAIDVTNYFAFQFYKGIEGIALQNAARIGETSIGNPVASLGGNTFISTYFLSAMGVSSFAQYGEILAKNMTDPGNMFATMVGIFIFQMLATAIFAYGAILLVVRIVVLMILMATSSLAVVAFLVPKMEQYFTQWYQALLKNAVFGPILMIMLWAAAHLSQAVVAIPNSRQALGSAVSSPKDVFGIMTLLSYLIVCGFLFAAIKIASSLSASSDKDFFGIAGALRKYGAGGTAALGLRGLQNIAGWNYKRQMEAALAAASKPGIRPEVQAAHIEKAANLQKKMQSNLGFAAFDEIAKKLKGGSKVKDFLDLKKTKESSYGKRAEEEAKHHADDENKLKAQKEALRAGVAEAIIGSDKHGSEEKERAKEIKAAIEQEGKNLSSIKQVIAEKIGELSSAGGEKGSNVQERVRDSETKIIELNKQRDALVKEKAAAVSAGRAVSESTENAIRESESKISGFTAQLAKDNKLLTDLQTRVLEGNEEIRKSLDFSQRRVAQLGEDAKTNDEKSKKREAELKYELEVRLREAMGISQKDASKLKSKGENENLLKMLKEALGSGGGSPAANTPPPPADKPH